MYPKYVKVSPDAPDEWWDPKAKVWFKKDVHIQGLPDGVIELKANLDETNIVRYVRFNYLMDATHLVNPPVIPKEEILPIIEKTPNQLLNESENVAAVEVVVEEVPVEEEPVKRDKEKCPYCGNEYALKGITAHKKSCKKNPDNQ